MADDHFWTFQGYLNENRPEDGRDFVTNTLVPFIQKMACSLHKQIYLCGVSTIPGYASLRNVWHMDTHLE